jgi:hypothetical protein
VEAEGRELARSDVLSHQACGGAFLEGLRHDVEEMCAGPRDVLVGVQDGCARRAALAHDPPVGGQEGLERIRFPGVPIADRAERGQMAGDLAPMPASAAIWAIVTAAGPRSATRRPAASSTASVTSRRWEAIESDHSRGMTRSYANWTFRRTCGQCVAINEHWRPS